MRTVTLLLLAASALGSLPPTQDKPKIPVVLVEKAKRTQLFDTLSYPARIVAKVNASVLAESDGIVTKIHASLGNTVKKGAPVIAMKHTDPVYQYAPVTVRAPVSGTVSLIEISEGSRVTKGQKLAAITDPTQTRILIEVAVSDLSSITSNLKGIFRIAGTEEEIPVTVLGVSPFVDPATGTASAELSALTRSSKTLPGIVGRTTFKVRQHSGIEVPDTAVVYRGKNTFIRIVENGKSKLVTTVLGETRQGKTEIVKGLNEGDVVVVRASTFVADGEEVKIDETGVVSPPPSE